MQKQNAKLTFLVCALVCGAGNDMLVGDAGNGTYVFARGEGKDTLFDSARMYFLDAVNNDKWSRAA